jgi:1-acyl-sn-glycerol-3-phosphate acyltransferase
MTSPAFVKLLKIFLHVLRGYWFSKTQYSRLTLEDQQQEIQKWARKTLDLIGISLQVRGVPAKGGVLRVANHISWLDIVVMHASGHCRFVAKSEIRGWPVIGALTTSAHSLYIVRASSRDALRVVHQMAQALRDGDALTVFPEGTTGDGTSLLPFHGNLLQAALSVKAPIQPIALKFIDSQSGERSFAPCYVGNDTLIGSLWRTLSTSGITAVVNYGDIYLSNEESRRDLALKMRQKVQDLL